MELVHPVGRSWNGRGHGSGRFSGRFRIRFHARHHLARLCGTRKLPDMKLITFLCCEKIIIEQDTSQVSLVSILQAVNVGIANSAELPPVGAIAPFPWAVLTLWHIPKGTTEATHEQFTLLVAEDGQEIIRSGVSRIVPPPPQPSTASPYISVNSRIVDRFQAFPIWKQGACTLKVMTRKIGESEWDEAGAYPLEIHYSIPAATSSTTTEPTH